MVADAELVVCGYACRVEVGVDLVVRESNTLSFLISIDFNTLKTRSGSLRVAFID